MFDALVQFEYKGKTEKHNLALVFKLPNDQEGTFLGIKNGVKVIVIDVILLYIRAMVLYNIFNILC